MVLNHTFIYWLIVHNNWLLFTYDIASLCLESTSLACDTLQLGSWSLWSLLSSLTNKFKWRTQGSEKNKMSINMVSSIETLHRFFEDTSTVSSLLTDTLISRLLYFWTLFSIPAFYPFFSYKIILDSVHVNSIKGHFIQFLAEGVCLQKRVDFTPL